MAEEDKNKNIIMHSFNEDIEDFDNLYPYSSFEFLYGLTVTEDGYINQTKGTEE